MATITKHNRTTANILADMLGENTGRHFLDSGDAYGRHWERNAGKTAQDFANEPSATVRGWKGRLDGITLNVFHYLLDRLEYDADKDAEFHAYAEDRDTYWLQDMEDWATSCAGPFDSVYTMNSYNGVDYLSQVIQYTHFRDEYSEDYVILQIHNGADVRGGYSTPRVFHVVSDLGDNASADIYCTGCDFGVTVYHGIDLYDNAGNPMDFDTWQGDPIEDGGDVAICPACNVATLAAEPVYAS